MTKARTRKLAGAAMIAMLMPVSASALTPAPACNIEERGMLVANATNLGFYNSGLLLEEYRSPNGPDGAYAAGKGPVPQLDQFNGFRVTDCQSGRAIAVHGDTAAQGGDKLLATEFLRTRAQRQDVLPFRQATQAVEALYGNDGFTRVVRLRLREETCACGVFYPERWKN